MGTYQLLFFCPPSTEDLITLVYAIVYLQNVRRQVKVLATSMQCYVSPQSCIRLTMAILGEQKVGGKHHLHSITKRRKDIDLI